MEVKIRVWHEHRKVMSDTLTFEYILEWANQCSERVFSDGINFKNVMLFTGVTDTDGKEIYEGDILEYHV